MKKSKGPPVTHHLSLDIETFSSENLSKCSVYRYAEAPDFQVLLIGYSLDFGPIRSVDLASGAVMPPELLNALLNPKVEKWAFNAAFERVCLSRFLRGHGYLASGFLSPAGWRCSMVWSAYLGLPMSLAGVGAVLGLDKQKLESGKSLIRFFCQPAAPSLLNGMQPRNPPSSDPERWKQFVEYNVRDVEAEMGIRQRLVNYPVPEEVWKEYELDQEINDRGIRVDMEFVKKALALDAISRRELTAELSRLTNISNPNSAAQIRDWLSAHGQEIESLSKKEVRRLLESQIPSDVNTGTDGDCAQKIREVLLLRQQLAKTSVRKYQAMENSVCADGRVRGMFQFYGAARSGRWAGRLVQLQNLPQNHLKALDEVRQIVTSVPGTLVTSESVESFETLKLIYDSVPDVLSELIRTAFIPAEGKRFIVCDFSAIEARVIAWLAGESWRQEVFAKGGDIYCASASAMFHVPVEKHGVNGHLRQKGKIAELALGYGGGTGALFSMGALDYGVREDELQSLVDAWRSANPNIVRLWWNVDKSVKMAIRQKTTIPLFQLRFEYRSGMLFIRLPSGRCLSYPKPRLCTNKYGGESVSYMGPGPSRRWEEIESYGPKFVENIVQGIARDLLCSAMRNLSDYRIVAHVHDEVIIEVDPTVTVEEIAQKMSVVPSWAKGLLLRSDGFVSDYYRKD